MHLKKRKSERGSALLEFALSWSLMWLLFAGLYQFGYAFYVYNLLLTQVTNATEMGSNMNYDTANTGAYTTALTNMVLYGSTTAGTNAVVPGLTSANVNVSVSLSNSYPTDLTITITNYSIDAVFTSFTLNGKPRATALYMGHITCSTC